IHRFGVPCLFKIVESSWLYAEDEERRAHACFVRPFGANEIIRAQEHFRTAATNWRIALQFGKAQSAEAKAKGAAQEMEPARRLAAEKEERERRLAQQREFDRQWESNAQKVVMAHP